MHETVVSKESTEHEDLYLVAMRFIFNKPQIKTFKSRNSS